MSKIRLTGSNSGYVEIASAVDAGNLTFVLPTSGTSLIGNGNNVYTGITTFTNDFKLEGGSYDVLWDASDNQLEFDDNAVLSFGAASDLQIYHSGANSFITDSGTGGLIIRGSQINIQNAAGTENKARFLTDGAAELYYDSSKKLETAASGAIVTGILTATEINYTGSQNFSNRNIIINGAMNIAQRGATGGTVTTAAGYKCVDTSNKTKKQALLRDIIKQAYEEPNEDEIDEILNSLKIEGKDKGFGMKELCIFVEFITRYYEHINKTNKHWFFTYEQQTMLRSVLQVN